MLPPGGGPQVCPAPAGGRRPAPDPGPVGRGGGRPDQPGIRQRPVGPVFSTKIGLLIISIELFVMAFISYERG